MSEYKKKVMTILLGQKRGFATENEEVQEEAKIRK